MEDTIVLYPSPGRGHLFSMKELGKLILKHDPSLHITIILSTLPHESTSDTETTVSSDTPSIKFVHLPVPETAFFSTSSHEDIIAMFFELPQLNNLDFQEAILTLSKSANIKALVIDFFCNAAFQVSSGLNIPTYYFYTSGASGLCLFLYLPVVDKMTAPKSLKDVDILTDAPGIPNVPSKEMPLAIQDRTLKIYRYFLDTAIQMAKSSGLIVNTFESLEEAAVKAIVEGKCTPEQDSVPPIYCIGPVIASGDHGSDQSRIRDKHECLTWLDSQPSRSVVFLCFGSMGTFSSSQLNEMASALERSRIRFLWVVRNPPPDDEARGVMFTSAEPSLVSILPEGFLDRTKDRGLVVKLWAPQVEVLNHDSVGGFVTHCGWNSVLEAVCAGVPMLAWPLYAEQKLNRIFLVEELKVALPVNESEDGLVSAAEMERRVTELMNSEKGNMVRERVLAFKEGAASAVGDGGCSHLSMAKLVESFRQGLAAARHQLN